MPLKKHRFNNFGGRVYWQIFDLEGQVTVWGDVHCFIVNGRFDGVVVEFFLADPPPVNPRLTYEVVGELNEAEFDRMLKSYIRIVRSLQP